MNPDYHLKNLFRHLLTVIGVLAVALAVSVIFLPLIPTTPLLLLAAFCFFRSSEKLYHRFLSHPWLSPYIRRYREGRGLPLKVKGMTIAVLWGTLSVSFFFAIKTYWLRVPIFLIVMGVTIYLLSLKSRE